MKKVLALLVAIAVLGYAPLAYAVAVEVDSVHFLSGGITLFKLSSVADGETHAVKGPVTGYWYSWTDDVSDTGADGVSSAVSGETTTYTFNLTNGGPTNRTCNFYIIKR